MDYSIFTSVMIMQGVLQSHLLFVIGLQFCTKTTCQEAENKNDFKVFA